MKPGPPWSYTISPIICLFHLYILTFRWWNFPESTWYVVWQETKCRIQLIIFSDWSCTWCPKWSEHLENMKERVQAKDDWVETQETAAIPHGIVEPVYYPPLTSPDFLFHDRIKPCFRILISSWIKFFTHIAPHHSTVHMQNSPLDHCQPQVGYKMWVAGLMMKHYW